MRCPSVSIDVMRPKAIAVSPRFTAMTLCGVGIVFSVLMVYALCEACSDLSLASLRAHRDELSAFTDLHYGLVVTVFMTLYVVQAALALPGRLLFTFAAGYLFGGLWGAVYINIWATVGATLAFLLVRHLFREWAEERIGRLLTGWHDRIRADACSYLVVLRLIPAVPFSLINLVTGLSPVRLGTFVHATAIGMLPTAFIFAYAGQHLGAVNTLEEAASPEELVGLALLAVLAATPIIYRYLCTGSRPQTRKRATTHPPRSD